MMGCDVMGYDVGGWRVVVEEGLESSIGEGGFFSFFSSNFFFFFFEWRGYVSSA